MSFEKFGPAVPPPEEVVPEQSEVEKEPLTAQEQIRQQNIERNFEASKEASRERFSKYRVVESGNGAVGIDRGFSEAKTFEPKDAYDLIQGYANGIASLGTPEDIEGAELIQEMVDNALREGREGVEGLDKLIEYLDGTIETQMRLAGIEGADSAEDFNKRLQAKLALTKEREELKMRILLEEREEAAKAQKEKDEAMYAEPDGEQENVETENVDTINEIVGENVDLNEAQPDMHPSSATTPEDVDADPTQVTQSDNETVVTTQEGTPFDTTRLFDQTLIDHAFTTGKAMYNPERGAAGAAIAFRELYQDENILLKRITELLTEFDVQMKEGQQERPDVDAFGHEAKTQNRAWNSLSEAEQDALRKWSDENCHEKFGAKGEYPLNVARMMFGDFMMSGMRQLESS